MPARVIRLVITGRVQGVAFRDFVQSEARARGLAGWVRNRRDGTVEALLAGAAEPVEEMVAACWRGPLAARVADIAVSETAEPDTGEGFEIRPTA